MKIFKKGVESNDQESSKQQILEVQQRLEEFIKKTTENIAIVNDRLNFSLKKVFDVDSFKKIETKVAKMSEEITKMNNLVNGTIKDYIQEIYVFMQEQKEKQKAKRNNSS